MRYQKCVIDPRQREDSPQIPDHEEKRLPVKEKSRGITDFIRNLDLSLVGMKLMEPVPEGKGWTREQVAEADMWYRRYLHLCLMYPNHPAVPNYPIDTFWHQHILDTRAYARDCQKVFGHFLHHYPYFGLRGDAEVRDDAFVETNILYRQEFDGEDCSKMVMFHRPAKVGPCHDIEGGGGKASACSNAPCSTEACKAGCKTCTVDGRQRQPEMVASACNHGGSGTGCGQGCKSR